MSRYGYYGFRPYVPVAERRRKAEAKLKKQTKKGGVFQPVALASKKIAASFWGKAWCDNLESYMDYANRLPRGRTYVRNGSVMHLEIKPGKVEAKVCGSELYTITVTIAPANKEHWDKLCRECAGQIGSLIELLSGKLSNHVMQVMTRRESGLFPTPSEIKLKCSCPDWADMCKHVAAALYGVGARLDEKPELLFLLRGVDQNDLIARAVEADITAGATSTASDAAPALDDTDLADVFGIEIETATLNTETISQPARTGKKVNAKNAKRKKPARKKTKPAKRTTKKVATARNFA